MKRESGDVQRTMKQPLHKGYVAAEIIQRLIRPQLKDFRIVEWFMTASHYFLHVFLLLLITINGYMEMRKVRVRLTQNNR